MARLEENSWWPTIPPPEIPTDVAPRDTIELHTSPQDSDLTQQAALNAVPVFAEQLRFFLILLASVVKQQLVGKDEAKRLKVMALRGEDLVFDAMQAYQADIDQDIEEFADTLRCILQL